jgi:hypothetical protein
MEPTAACTHCGEVVSSLIDQVLDLPAFTTFEHAADGILLQFNLR